MGYKYQTMDKESLLCSSATIGPNDGPFPIMAIDWHRLGALNFNMDALYNPQSQSKITSSISFSSLYCQQIDDWELKLIGSCFSFHPPRQLCQHQALGQAAH